MIRILVAEDDRALSGLVCTYLADNGYEAVAAYDGNSALDKFAEGRFDMVVTDIMMPGLDGYELTKAVREIDEKIPVLFMTALDDKPSKQYGYKLGVDDYVVKPFDADILMLKIGAILRRVGIEKSRELVVGNFRMNADEHTAYIDDEELPLTVREFDLLFKMLSFPKRAFSRSRLMEEFWDYNSSATSRTVDVYMAKLRDKTARCDGFEIVTVHGLGYKVILK